MGNEFEPKSSILSEKVISMKGEEGRVVLRLNIIIAEMRLGEKAKICKETYKRMGHDKTMTHP
jgi:hypothetical protein